MSSKNTLRNSLFVDGENANNTLAAIIETILRFNSLVISFYFLYFFLFWDGENTAFRNLWREEV